MERLITEPVKKVKLIVDDVTFIFDNPKIVHLMKEGEHKSDVSFYKLDLRIDTFEEPTAYRTVKKNGITEYERLA